MAPADTLRTKVHRLINPKSESLKENAKSKPDAKKSNSKPDAKSKPDQKPKQQKDPQIKQYCICLLYTSPSPRDS